ncbi:MAG TPA: hypothetical protein PLJ34_04965, partial [Hyphomicrobiales bacterium]|nr:hypothetical protein [Hyphomicrobiales bacterium]
MNRKARQVSTTPLKAIGSPGREPSSKTGSMAISRREGDLMKPLNKKAISTIVAGALALGLVA